MRLRRLGICCAAIAIALSFLVLVFVMTFVAVPFIYKSSVEIQRKTVFPATNSESADFSNFKKYKMEGAVNFNIVVDREKDVFLGVWHLLPYLLMNASFSEDFDYSEALSRREFPVLLHFHSSSGNRAKFIRTYNVLRVFFHVIVFDYRGYGDSSDAKLTETDIVEDSVQLVKWLRERTRAEIYFWGHGVGCAISTHAAKSLKKQYRPQGLFLEAPFTSMREQVQQYTFYKLFSWLPWFEKTMLDPLEDSDLAFNTGEYVEEVDYPIMIFHAEDDDVSPYKFSEKLYKIAKERSPSKGNATFHLIPSRYKCGHVNIWKAPELFDYIRDHIIDCRTFYYKNKS